jgi:rubrerythrin
MICPRCSYEWEPRKPNPKVCPRCKGRLDWHVPKVTQSKQKEVK